MLVLSRKKSECIVIDTPEGRITIMVVAFTGDKVRLGIDAPRSMSVMRAEIQEQIDGGKGRDK